MLFIDILNILLDEKGVKPSRMCQDIGVNKNAYYDWRDRGNVPKNYILEKIAAYFETSIPYLLGETDDPEPPNKKETPGSASHDKQAEKLFSLYSSLSETSKVSLVDYAGYLKDREVRQEVSSQYPVVTARTEEELDRQLDALLEADKSDSQTNSA